MTKKFLKYLTYLSILLVIFIIYLGYFGIETSKLNYLIKQEVLKKNINIKIKSVKILLNIKNFSLSLKTINPILIFDEKEVELENIKTNFSISSIISNKIKISNLKILTKEAKLKDILAISRTFKNNPQLFILNKIIKNGYLVANINLNFDDQGKILDDYSIKGFVKKGKLHLLNREYLNNLNFDFEIKNKEYSLKNLIAEYKKLNILSDSIKINDKVKFITVEGVVRNSENQISPELLRYFIGKNSENIDLKSLDFIAKNKFFFKINKRLKFSDLNIESEIDLKNIDYKLNFLPLKNIVPEYNNFIQLKKHKIKILYSKKKLSINGKGNFLIDNNLDEIQYKLIKKNNEYIFNSEIQFINNLLTVDFLDYTKKKNKSSLLKLKGKFIKDDKLLLKELSYQENNNSFLIKDLILDKKHKFRDVNLINMDFINVNKIKNKINIKKKNNVFYIKGSKFDASKLIDSMLEESNKNKFSNLLSNFNSKIRFDITNAYFDRENNLNNINGNMLFINNKLAKLDLNSKFQNGEMFKLTINTNKSDEKITTLFSEYASPIVKKYKFIKGFEEGILDFYSIKKNNISNSKLKIYDFKLKEISALTKLLTLASLQGIADLLTGEGIRFNDFEMTFSNNDNLMTIQEIYAIGPAISIMMDGYIESKKIISLRGTLVPATTINKFVSSIPILGKILVGKKTGEGVFGVSFKIKGAPKDLKTTVNPIKTLTPRFITRTLEKIKKN